MRWLALVSAVCAGCVGEVLPPSADPMLTETPDPGTGGGTPTRTCGESGTGTAVGCAVWRGSCFGSWGFSVSLTGAGDCIAAPLPGTLSAHGDVAFAADRVAAVQIADTLEISASAGDKVIVLALAAQPGTYSCSDAYGPRIGYFRNTDEPLATLDFRSWRGVPAICSVTLAAAGAIGERVQGSFSATLLDWRTDGGTLALAGTFDVERGAY